MWIDIPKNKIYHFIIHYIFFYHVFFYILCYLIYILPKSECLLVKLLLLLQFTCLSIGYNISLEQIQIFFPKIIF